MVAEYALSDDEFVATWRAERDTNTRQAMLNDFLSRHERFVWNKAYQLVKRYAVLNVSNDVDDVAQLVREAAIKVLSDERRFAPFSGAVFKAVWTNQAHVDIQGFARKQSRLVNHRSGSADAQAVEMIRIQSDLRHELKREPTKRELLERLCQHYGVDPDSPDAQKLLELRFDSHHLYLVEEPTDDVSTKGTVAITFGVEDAEISLVDLIDAVVRQAYTHGAEFGAFALVWFRAVANGEDSPEVAARQQLGLSAHKLRECKRQFKETIKELLDSNFDAV